MITKDTKTKKLPVIFPINMYAFVDRTAGDTAPTEIHVLPVGKWNHPAYGPLTITREDIAQFKENFDNGLRKGVSITEGHDGGFSAGELPSVGWFTELIDRGANGLYAIIEWTDKGKTLLSEKAFKFFSPEFYSEYEDPETRTIHENVLVGGALTNKPYFRELEALVMSEPNINNQFNFNENIMLELKNIVEKKVEELSTEEKTFLQEHKAELTDEQKTTFATALEVESEGAGEGESKNEGKGEGEGTDGKDGDGTEGTGEGEGTEGAGEGAGDKGTEGVNTEGESKGEGEGQQNASEFNTDGKGNVVMTMAEAKLLSKKANAGYEASQKLEASEIRTEAIKLVFSEQNSKGRFLPSQSEKVFSFMKGLTATQRKSFGELVSAIPASNLFNEVGHGGSAAGTAFAEVENMTKKLMSDDKALTYSDAVKRVFEENPELANRYENEK